VTSDTPVHFRRISACRAARARYSGTSRRRAAPLQLTHRARRSIPRGFSRLRTPRPPFPGDSAWYGWVQPTRRRPPTSRPWLPSRRDFPDRGPCGGAAPPAGDRSHRILDVDDEARATPPPSSKPNDEGVRRLGGRRLHRGRVPFIRPASWPAGSGPSPRRTRRDYRPGARRLRNVIGRTAPLPRRGVTSTSSTFTWCSSAPAKGRKGSSWGQSAGSSRASILSGPTSACRAAWRARALLWAVRDPAATRRTRASSTSACCATNRARPRCWKTASARFYALHLERQAGTPAACAS